ncbi:MAG TPA: DUF1489 domain-containing protein [Alphaproteobacteria bacterium]|nr:DUF1489 domain-containing protein [Alphaproteobacteria bacterium]
MVLHLIKLSVGTDSLADLAQWQEGQVKSRGRITHTTRMVPKRTQELLDGGSIYWIIKGYILGRQPLIAIEPFQDGEGIGRCHLVMQPGLIPVAPRARRPFQGWRYLKPADAPPDLKAGSGNFNEDLKRELAELGLL